MTPEQIRKMADSYTDSLEKLRSRDEPASVNLVNGITQGIMLVAIVEIAAQLAEMNQNYEEFKRAFTSNGAIDVNARGGLA